MKRITVTAKDHGLGQATIDRMVTEMYDRLETHLDPALVKAPSTGVYGQAFEPLVRHEMNKAGLTRRDFHARTNGSNQHIIEDGRIYVDGRWVRYDVKSGDPIVGYIEPTAQPELDEDQVMPGIDYVIYTAEVSEFENEDDLLDHTLVLTREEFLTFIATEGPKRSQTVATAVKFGTNNPLYRKLNKELDKGEKIRDCICLQNSYRAARREACYSKRYTTLRKFLFDHDRI